MGLDEKETQVKKRRKGPEAAQHMRRVFSYQYQVIAEGALAGGIGGAVVSVLRLLMHHAEHLRNALIQGAKTTPQGLVLALVLLAACCFIACLSVRLVPLASGSGIPQIKGEMQGQIDEPWFSVMISKLIGTVAGIGAGLSMGNEGPSVQIGAMAGKGTARLLGRPVTEEWVLMSAGVGAGLSCAFNAPLAAVMFVLEDIHNNLNKDVILTTMAAVVTSDFVSYQIFGLHPVVTVPSTRALPLKYYWLLLILGVILGAFGVFFNKFTDVMQNLYQHISNKSIRIIIPFLMVIPLAVFRPDALGTGYDLIADSAAGKYMAAGMLLLIVLKFFYSMCCTTCGTPGGIFLPLLVVGSLTGGLFMRLYCGMTGDEDIYLANFVLYGMVGYFAAVIRAPITGVLLVTEMTGNFMNFLSLTIVALVAYISAQLMHGQPIYDQLLQRLLRTRNENMDYGNRHHVPKVILDSDIHMGSLLDGQPISRMHLPKGSLVVAILHQGVEIVPGGSTVLHAGDQISVLCSARDSINVDEMLETQCRTTMGDWQNEDTDCPES
ncbi:MAG: chloride channel protein [Eubacterium sp.]|jgi:H+/Cl- antiporter ClcA|nr:chloride channel protein [Eubacterium sp.]MCH4047045.1 chloride channel protein [Eubacterium sp.]MCH4080143.1 chloride channel protein [Eubacterium sp.]MCH4110931.1 chloride channel protein [Eubacterium sp.]MCI1306774.1 chloride channel protein [Eubacterium sp.]